MILFTNYKVCALYLIMQMTTPYVVLILTWISWISIWKKALFLALKWFENNHMKANPSKFQAILFKCHQNEEVFDLNIGDELIKPVSHVKLLGVLIDDNLSFNEHVSKLCVKAAPQTNALCRIVKCIPNECCLDILIYIRHLYPQISTIVILCGIFVAIIALIK